VAGKELDPDHAHREEMSDGIGDSTLMMARLRRYQNGGSKRKLPKRGLV
jgi:hypothetical protein